MDPAAGVYDELATAVSERLKGGGPHVVGIGGAVAVGKSTIAEGLSETLTAMGHRVAVVGTDAFLFPNDLLNERGLAMRKGAPETFDLEGLASFLEDARNGERVEHPVYSHHAYDIVPGESVVLEAADVIVLEGVVALHAAVVPFVDVTIYVEADVTIVRDWFIERFLRMVSLASSDPMSFYGAFEGWSPEQVRSIAEATWDGINGPNFTEHIADTRENADLVLAKDPDHSFAVVNIRPAG